MWQSPPAGARGAGVWVYAPLAPGRRTKDYSIFMQRMLAAAGRTQVREPNDDVWNVLYEYRKPMAESSVRAVVQ